MDKLDTKKKAMLEALERALGIVTTACERANIARQTHYNWMKTDADYKAAVHLIHERTLDFAESSLHKAIKDGDVAAVIFYLKTRGKARGYVERQEVEIAERKPLSWFGDDSSTVS